MVWKEGEEGEEGEEGRKEGKCRHGDGWRNSFADGWMDRWKFMEALGWGEWFSPESCYYPHH